MPANDQQSKSYPVSLVVRETGQTHGVDGGARFDLIRDENGNPEVEYRLVADVDGTEVTLAAYNYGRLNTAVAAAQARAEAAQTASPTEVEHAPTVDQAALAESSQVEQ